ncbi:hypothetical protein LZ24_02137 [Desulfobotulus alkaliphilus]|uniref:Uncharacterized protein n=1 Tax=Desulfobotulus alkaliphilus TaxID=622671 RepID=A0A562RNS2_9BACT|nr:hypothetical protein [Desulfobotulus alkaliphilus]TWI70717.1 hypothetical protein LZ24_02137 [Desulfobotulus alkaliphilus]
MMKTVDHRKAYIKRDRFDFEIGYLKKSPCLDCTKKESFPACLKACSLLDAIQTELAAGLELSRDSGENP